MEDASGRCLCGDVRFNLTFPSKWVAHCHCAQCRRQTSHVFVGMNVRRTQLDVHGDDNVTWYRSSREVERGFCRVCGSALCGKPTIEDYEYTSIAMGLFEPPTGTRLARHTFVSEKSDYYDITDDLPQRQRY